MKKIFTTTLFVAALVLLLMISGRAAAADDVKIKDVDNYAGNSNVYTNQPNTTVTVTELDANGDPVESWTGTTDSEGKITIAAGHNLSKPYLKARKASGNQQAVVEGFVAPDNIYDRQPFTFAAPQTTKTVVNVQTVEGVVVQRASTDKYGRVFLAAGLPAGAYLISTASSRHGHTQPLGKLEIKQRPADALQRPGQFPAQPMQIHKAPQAVKLGDPLSLSGNGFSPNSADMEVNVAGPEGIHSVPVLAATEDQLKLGPATQLAPGQAELQLTNRATGQSARTQKLLVYDIQGRLERRKLTSGGDQTQLVLITRPESMPLRVQVAVLSGPVDFGSGGKTAEGMSDQGRAVFLVHAERGSGPFQLSWKLAPLTRIDDCKCDLATARCDIPDPGNTCWEWQNNQGQWSCGSH